MRDGASKRDCQTCHLKPRCCPRAPARKISRSVYEGARHLAREIGNTEAYQVSRRQRKKVEMLFAHLKRILKLDRLRLRGPNGARDEIPPRRHRPEPSKARHAGSSSPADTGLRGRHPSSTPLAVPNLHRPG
jgi:hypothetical protein